MLDALFSFGEELLYDAASWIDTELLGYGATELGMAEGFLMGADISQAIAPTALGEFAFDAYSAYQTIQPYASKALKASSMFGEGSSVVPKVTSARSSIPQMMQTGSFRSSSAAAFSGAADPRVVANYQRARASSNPSIQAAFSYISPTISSRGPTIALGEGSIKSLTKKGK